MEVLNEIYKGLQIGNAKLVETKTREAIDNDILPEKILNKALIASMEELGINFKNGRVFLPEVMMAARAMQAAMNILKPKLVETGVKPVGKAVIGTVKGDQHDIGKNLVAMMMMGSGIEVIDLGIDVPPEKFIRCAVENDAQIIALSALLSTTMPQQAKVIEELKKAGLREKIKVIVGGAPVTENFAREIGADAYTPDAGSAALKAKELIYELIRKD
ncbi:MAG: B12-binding domain-containing protein [Deltaproteobacteria bacterium]